MPFNRVWWRDNRGKAAGIAALTALALIDVFLFSMQVINRPEFLKTASGNRLRAEIIEPARGRILDRNGVALIENRPSYTLYAQPWIIGQNPAAINLLASALTMDPDSLRDRIAFRGWRTFTPTSIQRDVPYETLARLQAVQLDIPGMIFGLESKRSYLHPEATHILGYLGERSSEETDPERERIGQVGKRGLEKIYQDLLGGDAGIKYLQVDATGRITGYASDYQPISAVPGWDLYLNLDAGLQSKAWELMQGKVGAVVALDPRDGGVLVMLSQPAYDPSLFSGVMPVDVWSALSSDPDHPMLNRAIQGVYPPGSAFKMVMLSASLQEGLVNENSRISCPGGLQVGNRWFRCWNHGGHGSVGPIDALQRSCDVFFYQMGLKLGVDRFDKYGRQFGFGSKTGIDLDGESSGLLPGLKYLNQRYGENKWSRGLLANLAIGQGEVLVTPLQLAVYVSAIATGYLVQPHLANHLVDPVSREVRHVTPSVKPLQLDRWVLDDVREAMRRVVNEPGGTAFWLKNKDIEIAGKTGTAQNPHGKDHALFVAFAPFKDPVIAVAVVVEHGEHGSTCAAPIACELINKYLIKESADSLQVIAPDSLETHNGSPLE